MGDYDFAGRGGRVSFNGENQSAQEQAYQHLFNSSLHDHLRSLTGKLPDRLIDATVVPGFLSRRLAEKGFVLLGRCEETRLPSVGMTVLVERPYLQQNMETLQDVLKALVEGMVFITAPKNKPAVLETITKQFKLTDQAAAEGAYQDVFTLVRLEEYRKPTFQWMDSRSCSVS